MIDIYFLFTKDFEAIDLAQYEIYLTAEEIKARDRFVFQKDKDQYLLTRTLVRKVFAEKFKLLPSEIEFDKNPYGKPFIKHPATDLVFNISHTAGLIILGLAENLETIGIDIENTSRPTDIGVIMPTVFMDQEIESLLSLPKTTQKSRFFDIWTLKESYMKAVGKGFYLPPKSFRFVFEGREFELEENPLEPSKCVFNFELLDFNEIYKMAICYPAPRQNINTFCVFPYWNVKKFDGGK